MQEGTKRTHTTHTTTTHEMPCCGSVGGGSALLDSVDDLQLYKPQFSFCRLVVLLVFWDDVFVICSPCRVMEVL